MTENTAVNARDAALKYHANPKPGKLEIRATKPMANGRDLSLAYSPGVAEACLEIKNDPQTAAQYTARGNLVAVVSNGSAVLGLGNIGALASKPVMEGKAVLFKKFANIDCFDIEVDEADPEKLAEIVCALEPSFGAINLEDIKAPDCFVVEKICRERMGIPVFHDDQHGTAIVVGAAATNALRVAGKNFEDIKVVSTGGGAAGIACLNMLLKLGVQARERVAVRHCRAGLRGPHRGYDPAKGRLRPGHRDLRTLDDVIDGADLFLGLVGPRCAETRRWSKKWRRSRSSLRWPTPRPRSCPKTPAPWPRMRSSPRAGQRFSQSGEQRSVFPLHLPRRAGCGRDRDQRRRCSWPACRGIAELARATTSAEAAAAYQGEQLTFGADYLIPKPFDPRLINVVAGAVAKAAMESGVAHRPLEDLEAYMAKAEPARSSNPP